MKRGRGYYKRLESRQPWRGEVRDINTLAKRIISEIQGTVGQLNSKIKEKPLGDESIHLGLLVSFCWRCVASGSDERLRDSCLDTP